MTFTEAAAQVLRLVGKPLHYKEITDVAIEKNLLSHVGKSPEVTMGARLAALVKKGDKENPLVRLKPGVFALREWDQETIEKGLRDRTPALEKLSGQELDFEAEPEVSSHVSLAEFAEEGEPLPPNAAERERAELAAHAGDLFESEEDDDRPIFSDEPEVESADGAARTAAGDDGSRRRRRRRRRGRGVDERGGGDDLPSYSVSDAPAELPQASEVEAREPREAQEPREAREPRESREPREAREGREPRAPREPREPRQAREARDGGRELRDGGRELRDGGRELRDGGRELRDGAQDLREGGPESREGREPREPRDRDFRDRDNRERDNRERDFRDGERAGVPLADLAGKPLADAIESLLAGFDRNRGPVSLQMVADAAQRRGRLNGDAASAPALIQAAVRADNLRRCNDGRRPRFRVSGGRIALTDWQVDGDLGRAERDLFHALERYRDVARRSLLRGLQDLPQRALGEVFVLLLEQLGYTDLTPVRRPGSHGAELHLCAKAKGSLGDVRTAIVARRDGREIGRERVTELRGALHHYGPAFAGLLLTTGQVLSGAREEASAPGAAPVSVIDGAMLARLCEEHAVGTTGFNVRLPLIDADLFEGLRAG
jgi:hypothetical protein